MKCPELKNLKLDKESRDAVKRVRRTKAIADRLAAALTAGQIATIFTSKNPLMVSYNISRSDWELYAEAMRGVPKIAKRRIRNIAGRQRLRNEYEGNFKQVRFWKAVEEGCKPNAG